LRGSGLNVAISDTKPALKADSRAFPGTKKLETPSTSHRQVLTLH
jgi:hypothetical protein